MRLVALILAFFFIGLSFIPCADTDLSQENSISISVSQTDHDDDDPEADLCSTFCICHCCHSHFVAEHNFYSSEIKHPEATNNTCYSDLLTDGFQMSVLQPPKV